MIVCICARISDRGIATHAPAWVFEEIQVELGGVAITCGQCETVRVTW
jgi:bacterioferritin-associated ferredoxin